MKVRVLKNIDGSVSVIHPAPKSQRLNESESDWLDRVLAQATPKDAEYVDIDKRDLPGREDRDAWEFDSVKAVKINVSKRIDIANDRIVDDRTLSKARKEAIEELKGEGKLPPGYKDKKAK